MRMSNESTPNHAGHRARIKQRYMERGINSIDDKDVLELILTYAIPRKDVYDIARRLLVIFGSVDNVLRAEPELLKSLGKLTDHTVTLLKLFCDMRFGEVRFAEYRDERLTSVIKTAEYCHRVLSDSDSEVVLELFLDDSDRVTDMTKVSHGTDNEAVMPVETIVSNALRYKVRRIVIAHNHPSGNSKPSTSDLIATDALKKALESRGITLLEHIIVAREECTALLHLQTIPFAENEPFAPWL